MPELLVFECKAVLVSVVLSTTIMFIVIVTMNYMTRMNVRIGETRKCIGGMALLCWILFNVRFFTFCNDTFNIPAIVAHECHTGSSGVSLHVGSGENITIHIDSQKEVTNRP